MPVKDMTDKDKWLLALIGSTPYIRGRTRLQKYGILVQKEIFNNSEFFDDWRSGKFGMYSQQLTNSLEKLENNKYVIAYDTVDGYGSNKTPTKNYKLTDSGTALKNEWVKDKKVRISRIRYVISAYANKSLGELLHDTYKKFPEYTNKSTIAAKVRKKGMSDVPYLYSGFDREENIIPTKPSGMIKEHVFNDEDFRLELAKSIGRDKMPSLDPASFDKLKGLFSNKIESKYFDTVELINESRGH